MEGPACIARSLHSEYMAETAYNSTSMDSGSSGEDSSSMRLPSMSTEPTIWEGWTQLKCSSLVDTSNSISSEYPEQYIFPQTDLLPNWSNVGQSTAASATPYMDLIRQSASGVHESYGSMYSPTRMIADVKMPSGASSGGSGHSMFSESLRTMRNPGPLTHDSGHLLYLHSAVTAARRDEEKPPFDAFCQLPSYGPSKAGVGGSQSFMQFPISPESPISPLDLNSVVQQLSNRRHPESSWAEARFQSETCAMQQLSLEQDSPASNDHTDSVQYPKRSLFSESISSEGYNQLSGHTRTTSGEEISSQSVAYHLEVLAKGNVGTLASNGVNVFAPTFGSPSSEWSQLPDLGPTTSRCLNSIPPSINHCSGAETTTGPSRQPLLQRRLVEQAYSVGTAGSSILDTSAGGVDQPGSCKERVDSGKRRSCSLESKKVDDQHDSNSGLPSKNRKLESGSAWQKTPLRKVEPPSFEGASSYSATQTVEVIAAGPALNTNGKPRAKRGSATDPQSVYARNRRKRLDERLKTLQGLVPNGAKVDIVTMLDEAFNYVKFLELQVELLKSDDLWVYATPNQYNDVL